MYYDPRFKNNEKWIYVFFEKFNFINNTYINLFIIIELLIFCFQKEVVLWVQNIPHILICYKTYETRTCKLRNTWDHYAKYMQMTKTYNKNICKLYIKIWNWDYKQSLKIIIMMHLGVYLHHSYLHFSAFNNIYKFYTPSTNAVYEYKY